AAAHDRQDAGPTSKPSANLSMLAVRPAKGGLRPRNSFEVCFPIGIIWGLLGLSAEFAIGFVQERTGGTLLRLRVAPLSRAAILSGNGLACFTSCVGVTCMLLAIGHIGFGVRLTNLAVLVPAVVC